MNHAHQLVEWVSSPLLPPHLPAEPNNYPRHHTSTPPRTLEHHGTLHPLSQSRDALLGTRIMAHTRHTGQTRRCTLEEVPHPVGTRRHTIETTPLLRRHPGSHPTLTAFPAKQPPTVQGITPQRRTDVPLGVTIIVTGISQGMRVEWTRGQPQEAATTTPQGPGRLLGWFHPLLPVAPGLYPTLYEAHNTLVPDIPSQLFRTLDGHLHNDVYFPQNLQYIHVCSKQYLYYTYLSRAN